MILLPWGELLAWLYFRRLAWSSIADEVLFSGLQLVYVWRRCMTLPSLRCSSLEWLPD